MSIRITLRRSALAVAAVFGLTATTSLQGQVRPGGTSAEPPRETRWDFHAELGASTRTRWSSASNAPTVSAATGPMVGLGVRRWLGNANVSLAARLSESAVELDELGTRWDGGTLRDVQLIGTVGLPITRGRLLRADVEAGGGVTLTSAPDNVEPFMSSPTALATSEVSLLLRLPEGRVSASNTIAFVQQSMSLLIRYNLMRVSPTPDTRTTTGIAENDATDGWVGRLVVGVRVTR